MPTLTIQVPGQEPLSYNLHKTITSVGSDADCDVCINDPMVSKTTATIQFDGQIYTVVSIAKKSELLVNGKTRKKHKLSEGDQFGFGPVKIKFSLVSKAPPTKQKNTDDNPFLRIVEFSNRLMKKNNVGELLETMMDSVIKISSADKGFLILMNGDDLDVKVARNLNKENIANAISQLSDSIVAKVVSTLKPVIVSDAMHDEEFSSAKSVMQLKLSSVICIPLLEQGKLLGILYVGNDSLTGLMNEDTLRLCTVFAAQGSLILSNALYLEKLKYDNKALYKRLDNMRFGAIVGSSPPMQGLYKKVDKVAATDISVLITGETGTGKELIAREIHSRSERSKEKFVVINCGAIPENLLESELFGHVKGAFTGAVSDKLGKFQVANKGTLFLDEIGEMPHPLQVKLLRAIQERVVTPVGSQTPKHVDIRILAATHRDLNEQIKAGHFREDLFYRLNVINLHLPPLKERGDDVVVIARYLLAKYAKEYNASVKGFTPDATKNIRRHKWPGNIREMENKLKKAIVLSDSNLLSSEDLDLLADSLPAVLPLTQAKEQFQRDYINEILTINEGNRTKTAKDLGVDPRTIFRHLEKEI